MPDTPFPVKPSLSFAKLVATPTETAWSQAYNAGNLFACLTLIKKEPNETISLPSLGKDSLNILESEFFTLEEKTTEAIKKAVTASLEALPADVEKNITIALFKDDQLTIFIAGSGKVLMKRGEQTGVLLEKYAQYDKDDITSASGFLLHNDTIILESGEFAKKVSAEAIASALELSLPNDIVEVLTPQIHEHEDGAQSAIVITFHSANPQSLGSDELMYPQKQSLASLYSPEKETPPLYNDNRDNQYQEEELIENEETPEKRKFELPKVNLPKLGIRHFPLNHKRKLYLTVAIILASLLIISIFMAVKKQSDEAQQTAFQNIYTTAKQYYDEGQGLESLNPTLSRESYLKAQQKLQESEGKIAKGSEEDKQIQELVSQVESALKGSSPENTTESKETTAKEHSLLAVEKENPTAAGFGQDDKLIYFIDAESISSQSKSSGAKKTVIKNNDSWDTPKAVVPYQANIYILDQKKGVIKYIGTSSKSNYFASESPDLSKATGMAIDGSVWIVTSDGKILKYTKGKKDNFGLTGFDKSLNNPSKIYTTVEMNDVYILDNGNKRIVKINKDGTFQKAITSPVIAQAKDFDIIESDKKVYVLSNNKVYEFPL